MSEVNDGKQLGHPFLIYTLARIGLLLAVGVGCYLLGARSILLIVLAFVLSGLLSYVLLDRSRSQAGMRVGSYFARLNSRIDSSAKAEDDLVDQAAMADADTPPGVVPSRLVTQGDAQSEQ